MNQSVDHCENCGEMIGALEIPMVRDGHVLCPRCWGKLSPVPVEYESRRAIRSPASRSRIPSWAWRLVLYIVVLAGIGKYFAGQFKDARMREETAKVIGDSVDGQRESWNKSKEAIRKLNEETDRVIAEMKAKAK